MGACPPSGVFTLEYVALRSLKLFLTLLPFKGFRRAGDRPLAGRIHKLKSDGQQRVCEHVEGNESWRDWKNCRSSR